MIIRHSPGRGEGPRDHFKKSAKLDELANNLFVGYKVLPPGLH